MSTATKKQTLKYTFDTAELKTAMAAAALSITGGKTDIESDTIRLRLSDDHLIITSSDGIMATVVRVDVRDESGSPRDYTTFTSSYRMSSAVRVAPGMFTTLTVDEKGLVLSSDKFRVRLPIGKRDHYISDGFSQGEVLTPNANYGEFKNLLKSVAWLVPQRISNPEFKGVHIVGEDVVASDIKSMVISSSSSFLAGGLDLNDIGLDKRFVQVFTSLPVADDAKLELRVDSLESPSRLFVLAPGLLVAAPLMAAPFPPSYKKYIDTSSRLPYTVDRADALACLSRVTATMRANGVDFPWADLSFVNDVCTVNSYKDVDITDEFYLTSPNEPTQIRLDIGLMETFLRNADSETVTIWIGDGNKPLLLEATLRDEPYTFVLAGVVSNA